MFFKNKFALFASSGLLTMAAVGISLSATAGPPTPQGVYGQMAPLDVGPTVASTPITASVILKVKHRRELVNFIQSTGTPGDANYHHFLSVAQFHHRFAPSDRDVHQLVSYLQFFGITANKIYSDGLDISVTGTAGQLSAAFSTELHDYVQNSRRFYRPTVTFSMPGELASLVLAVPGLDSKPGRYHDMIKRLDRGIYAPAQQQPVIWPKNGTASGIPGYYTVGDVANMYQVNPLYRAGINGRGETVGIMTLVNFNIADAYTYWKDIGLKVKPNRITKVLVDGGTPVQPNANDDETSLDVEQSGGMAPQAKVRVYIAPNTNQGFVDVFYTAVNENKADSLSISWGGD